MGLLVIFQTKTCLGVIEYHCPIKCFFNQIHSIFCGTSFSVKNITWINFSRTVIFFLNFDNLTQFKREIFTFSIKIFERKLTYISPYLKSQVVEKFRKLKKNCQRLYKKDFYYQKDPKFVLNGCISNSLENT